MPAVKAHLRALPYQETAAGLETIEASRAGLAAKGCLRYLVLTACRSGEARGATWAEIDLDAREWRIPASRMKAGVEHRVPLSDAALAVLERVRPLRGPSDLVFPSPSRSSKPLSDMTLTKVLRGAGWLIYVVVKKLEAVGFHATRNKATGDAKGTACAKGGTACDAVGKAFGLGYKAVEKIWESFRALEIAGNRYLQAIAASRPYAKR